MKKNLLAIIPVAMLLFLSVLTHRTWFDPNAILTNGDIWFLYKEGMITSNWGTWTSVLSLGELNVSYNLFLLTLIWQVVSKLGFNYQVANQIVYFFPIIFLTPIAIYCYLKQITKDSIASFFGSLVYLFTTFFLMMQNGGLLFAIAYAFLPLQFYFLEKYLRSEKIKDGLYLVLVLSLALFYELRIVYISIFVFVFYILFYYFTYQRQHFFRSLFRFVVRSIPLFITLLIVNTYIYAPLIFSSIKASATVVASRGLFGVNFFTLREPFVLMHPFWTGKVPAEFISQPIPFYFWIFPLLAFASLFFAKKEKNIIFFAWVALVMVFLGKSAADPLGGIYTWLYYNFPGFGFFREPSKFWLMLCFSYSVLIAYTISNFLRVVRSMKKRRILASILFCLPLLAVTVAVFIIGKPAFTTEIGPLFQPLFVTKEHYAVKDFIAKQQDFFRTYYIPGRYRMGYWSEIHPMLGLNEVSTQFQTLDPRILSLLSVKYVIQPPDITNDVYRTWGSKKVYQEQATNAMNLKKIENPAFETFSVYENTFIPKPRIYTPSELTYIIGNSSDLLTLMPLVASTNPAFYFAAPDTIEENRYNDSDQVFITSRCIRCEGEDYKSGLIFPFAKILPQSPFYSFIASREQKRLQAIAQDPSAQLQLAVFYGAKKMAELQSLNDGSYPSQFALLSLQEQKKLLTITENDLKKSINTLSNDTLFYLYDYLRVQSEIAQTFLTKKYLDSTGQQQLKSNSEKLQELIHIVYNHIWISNDQNNRYELSVPKDGNYSIALQSQSDQEIVQIDDKHISLTAGDKKGWVTSEIYQLSQGMHKVSVAKPKSLVDDYPSSIVIPQESEREEITIPIEGFEDTKTYNLSFNYKVSDNSQVHSYLEKDTDYMQSGIINLTADRYLLADNRWHAFSGDNFQSRFGERKNILKFIITKPKGDASTLELQNLQFKKITSSLLVATQSKEVTSTVFKSQPTISFQWINPTKYLVHISNATEPFYLVLNENFHSDWDAFYAKKNKGLPQETIVAKKDNVSEMKGKNDLDLFSFINMFSKNEKISQHFSINSYANAWYVDKKGDYTVIIEFLPQRIFTLTLFISGVAFCLSIFWLLYLKFKK